MDSSFFLLYGEATKTAFGFFWKAGWAFVLGYFVSSMIQAFVPKGRLTPYMGKPDFKSVSLSTMFGAIASFSDGSFLQQKSLAGCCCSSSAACGCG